MERPSAAPALVTLQDGEVIIIATAGDGDDLTPAADLPPTGTARRHEDAPIAIILSEPENEPRRTSTCSVARDGRRWRFSAGIKV